MADDRLTPATGGLGITGYPPRLVVTQRVMSLEGLRAAIKERGESGRFAFRGYYVPVKDDRDAPRALITGLERACKAVDDGTPAAAREVAIVREFMRRAHHYLPDVPRDDNWLEWLALMQHHGAPTRLLDWTYSPSVAVHFALSHAARQPAEFCRRSESPDRRCWRSCRAGFHRCGLP